MKKVIILLFAVLYITGCINLKEPYPNINYYKLTPEKSSVHDIGALDNTIMLRDFTASSEIETTHILTLWDNSHIQKYFYHRWIAETPSMVTDFINAVFSNNDFFKKGVVTASSMAIPDYIIEGEILDMMAYSTHSSNQNENYVYISLKITLVKRKNIIENNSKIVLSEVYPFKIPRKNNSVKTIPEAFSRAWLQVADQILVDIHNAIVKDNSKKDI